MALAYPPFTASKDIKNASMNKPPLKTGSSGGGVYILQASLIDLGYKMPISTKKTGFPDGKYGNETVAAVIQYQKDAMAKKINPAMKKADGIAGKNTIAALDMSLMAKFKKPTPPPTPPITPKPLPPSNKDYKQGSINPIIKPDKGSGVFNSEKTTATAWALKQTILEILPPRGSSAAIIIGFDASKNMKHYLNASGARLTLNVEGMIAAGPTAKARFRDEINQAKKFVESLPVGNYQITSVNSEAAYNYKEETWNWFYAVGGYQSWGKGSARVTHGATGKQCELDFEYHVFDRYNWDKGKKVEIGPITITDEFMGEFHRQGLAQEFDMKGLVKRKFSWRAGSPIPSEQYNRGSGR